MTSTAPTIPTEPLSITLHQGDLPQGLEFGSAVAVDSETLGLNPLRDKLCVVQLSAGDGHCHLVQLDRESYQAPRLAALMADPTVVKIFHYARFDVAALKQYLHIDTTPVFCTKIASKLVRTYTGSHGLKDVTKELLGIELSKEQQSSDWGRAELTVDQQRYAAFDVLYLHAIRERLTSMLVREGRLELAEACFDFLGTRAALDLAGWDDHDIFSHK